MKSIGINGVKKNKTLSVNLFKRLWLSGDNPQKSPAVRFVVNYKSFLFYLRAIKWRLVVFKEIIYVILIKIHARFMALWLSLKINF